MNDTSLSKMESAGLYRIYTLLESDNKKVPHLAERKLNGTALAQRFWPVSRIQ